MTFSPKFRGEAGMTLVETMAALTLLSVVVLLASGFMLNSHSNRETIATAVEQQHETNAFVQELRRTYTAASGTGDLAFRDLPDGLDIELLAINGAITPPVSPLTGINFDAPLSLDVTTVTESGEKLTVQTTWRPQRETQIQLSP